MRTKIKCKHCGYITTTKSKLGFITCSSCTKKTPNKTTKEV